MRHNLFIARKLTKFSVQLQCAVSVLDTEITSDYDEKAWNFDARATLLTSHLTIRIAGLLSAIAVSINKMAVFFNCTCLL